MGIGTNAPAARLHVTDSSVLFSATGDVPGLAGDAPYSGDGRRTMWYADKAAFRTGYVAGNRWDRDSVGSYSFASGYNTRAGSSFTNAMGNQAVATGLGATSIGGYTQAQGSYATALGNQTLASGNFSFAAGYKTSATFEASVALGAYSVASNYYAVALGASNIASGYSSVALGGNTIASGYNCTSIGYRTVARSFAETVVGLNNEDYSPVSGLDWKASDRLFVVGNGVDVNNTSNALTILKNGNTGIGVTAPSAVLHLSGAENNGSTATLKIQSGTQLMIFDGNEIDATTTVGADADLYLQNNSNRHVIMANGGGKVGINIIPSTYLLEVNGTAAKPSGGSWSALSDARLKQDINPYTDGLQQVLKIQPVTYHYNSQSGYDTKPEYVGVLAQQLKEVAPYMTSTCKKGGEEYLAVDNSAMMYMLVNAVKELAKQNEEMRKEIEQMKKRR